MQVERGIATQSPHSRVDGLALYPGHSPCIQAICRRMAWIQGYKWNSTILEQEQVIGSLAVTSLKPENYFVHVSVSYLSTSVIT